MNNDICKGDLVMVVGNPLDMLCDHAQLFLGHAYIVSSIRGKQRLICSHCGRTWMDVECANFDAGKEGWLRVSWLKKINPPAIPETVEHDEEITA